ncbi:HdeD family acid-resistance protein [Halosimplex marinum]|uniref:HdeD family acid-resistance protein n=1 Tax=Halosimplex marinum TaxID=3396620 RepID=UPI003F547590
MSTDTPGASSTVLQSNERSWRYLVGVGVLISVLGGLAVLAPFATGIGVSLLLGGLLVVGAISHAVLAFRSEGLAGTAWQVALALVYAAAGASLIANPVVGLATLTILLIAYFAVEGVVEVVGGLRMRPDPRWGWMTGSGVVSLLLAGLLWVGFPSTAVWALGLLTGIHLLSTGIMLVLVGYLGRRSPSATGGGAPGGEPGSN